ncbi:MAG: cysteine-rich CWC family protein [Burkholderiaceae bacterium]|nr:cysteine-rich CWC family protein [Burkholderiaceae bacterium]
MSEQATTIDPLLCPLCGQANACAMANGNDNAEPCWCVGLTFGPDVLARVPPEAQRLACICQRCVQADSSRTI